MRHGNFVAFEITAKTQTCSLYLTHVKRSVQPNSNSIGQRSVHHKYHLCVCAKYDHRPQELSWSPLSKARVYRPRSSVSQFTPLGNRSPPVVHANLPLSPAHTGRLVIIGDVHGCVLELAQLLKKVEFNRTTDKLVFVGDLCNKGPRSQQAVQLAMAFDATVVRGNHDDAALASYYEHRKSSANIKPMGVRPATVLAYCIVPCVTNQIAMETGRVANACITSMNTNPKSQWVLGLSPPEARFLAQMPFTVKIPSLNVMIAHAGLVPGIPRKRQRLQDLYRMRVLYPYKPTTEPYDDDEVEPVMSEASSEGFRDALASETADDDEVFDDDEGAAASSTGSEPWAAHWVGPGHVIFGHDARRGLQRYDYATGIDTGCVYGRELTACIIPLLPQGQKLKSVKYRTPTFAELQAELVSVPAKQPYSSVRGRIEIPIKARRSSVGNNF